MRQIHTDLELVGGARIYGAPVVLQAVIDGGGAAITTGIKGDLGPFPWRLQIENWTVLADQVGSIQLDLWRDAFANYPPTVAGTITAAAKPAIVTALAAQSSALTGWSTILEIGQVLRVNVDSATTLTRATLALQCRKIV